jgi:hypothetical protein
MPMECGANANLTVILCTWVVEFDVTGGFRWDHSDTGPVYGSYQCTGSMITVRSETDFWVISAQYDAQADRLTWNGALYAPQ